MKPHIHVDVIKAAADGQWIQRRRDSGCEWDTSVTGEQALTNYSWDESYQYRASLADVEGKPVFEGDELYDIVAGCKKIIRGALSNPDGWSWNPPKPKTITVTIPRPACISFSTSSPQEITLYVVSAEERNNTYNIIKEAMK